MKVDVYPVIPLQNEWLFFFLLTTSKTVCSTSGNVFIPVLKSETLFLLFYMWNKAKRKMVLK